MFSNRLPACVATAVHPGVAQHSGACAVCLLDLQTLQIWGRASGWPGIVVSRGESASMRAPPDMPPSVRAAATQQKRLGASLLWCVLASRSQLCQWLLKGNRAGACHAV
jgi:hypothetical protein